MLKDERSAWYFEDAARMNKIVRSIQMRNIRVKDDGAFSRSGVARRCKTRGGNPWDTKNGIEPGRTSRRPGGREWQIGATRFGEWFLTCD